MKINWVNGALGSKILYRTIDDGGKGIPIVFSGGLGGTHLVWAGLSGQLREHHKLILWEYPGLPHGTPGENYLDIPFVASCMKSVFDDAGIDAALIIGWSLGPQVNLEFANRFPDQVVGSIAICGDANPFADSVDEPISEALGLRSSFPNAVGWLSERIDRIEKLRHYLRKSEHPTRWAKRLGFISPEVEEIAMDAVIRDFIDLPPRAYGNYVRAAAGHDATPALKSLSGPLLVMYGTHDRIIPPKRAKQMADLAPRGEHFAVRGATHFAPLEFPQILAAKVHQFLKRHALT